MQTALALKASTGLEKNKKDVPYFLIFISKIWDRIRLDFIRFTVQRPRKQVNVNMKGMNAKKLIWQESRYSRFKTLPIQRFITAYLLQI